MERLGYRIEERGPANLRFEEDGLGSLTFRMTPGWAAWLEAGVPLTMAAMWAGLMAWGWMTSKLSIPTRVPWGTWLVFAGGIVLFTVAGASSWRTLRLYGHLPRVLAFDQARGVLRDRRERKWRWREWPRERVVGAHVREMRSIAPRRVVRLVVKIKGRRIPIQAFIGLQERAAAEAFVQRLNEWVGMSKAVH